ncbi:MAG: fibrobacter succinogenes major paralogous domain-containing protein [Prevotella sp.]|jgi:uncharacterized protein (TIGR02145 family)
MKRTIFIPLLLLALLCACSDDDNETTLPTVLPEATGQFTDARDGNVYHWVRFGGLDWTVENASYNTGDDNCAIYQTPQDASTADNAYNDTLTLRQYGYLYNLTGAQTAVPDGWRLPTDEDWQKLEMALGMSQTEAEADGWRGSVEAYLLTQGDEGTGLSLRFGGFYDFNSSSYASHFLWLTAMAYYWTSTTNEEGSLCYMRKLLYNRGEVWRHTTSVNNKLSVRFVRDAE